MGRELGPAPKLMVCSRLEMSSDFAIVYEVDAFKVKFLREVKGD